MESWAVGQRVGTSARVLGQDVGASLIMASDCPEETGLLARKPLHPGETREGSGAAARVPHSFLTLVRNSWKPETSCRRSVRSGGGLKPGALRHTLLQGGWGLLQASPGDIFNARPLCRPHSPGRGQARRVFPGVLWAQPGGAVGRKQLLKAPNLFDT